jgi:hypothetical protein
MRIWDINPGYLNRQSLLGEHRELHGLVSILVISILVNGKKGYSKHPETMRWYGYGWAIKHRHSELACEMKLRGYTDNTPVKTRSNKGNWPTEYIDEPHIQYQLLRNKYKEKEDGRILLPMNIHNLWSQHKYSVLARDLNKYKQIGFSVSNKDISFEELAKDLVEILRIAPSEGGIRNSAQHMWGHVSGKNNETHPNIESWSISKLIGETQKMAKEYNEPYLMNSTALSELMAWL